MAPILAPSSVGISELKANPPAVHEASGDQLLGYLLTAEAWAKNPRNTGR